MKLKRSFRYLAMATASAVILPAALWLSANAPNAEEDQASEQRSVQPILAAARGVVEVEGGLLKITTPRDGRVVSIETAEMKQVRAGDVLARLDSQQEELGLKIAESETGQAEARLRLVRAKAKAATKLAERMQQAATGKAVSEQALDDASAAKNDLAAEADIAVSALEAAKARAALAARDLDMRIIRAPVDGIVILQTVKVGDTVSLQAMTDMFTLLPAGDRIVRAEIPEQFLEGVKPDVAVEVFSDDRAAQPVPGRILRISPVLMQATGQLANERNDTRTATSIIAIRQDASLRVGQRVMVRVYK